MFYFYIFVFVTFKIFKIAETKFDNSYLLELEKLGLPYVITFEGKIYTVESIQYKRRQAFYLLEDGTYKHASLIKKLSQSEMKTLSRDIKIKKILQ